MRIGRTAAATGYRPRLQRRLMAAFAGYTLVVGTLFAVLAMVFAYAVEDEFFAAELRAEAQRQQAHHAADGRWLPPVLPHVRLYPHGEALPADLARAMAAHPRSGELAGDEGRHYHLRRLDADGTLLVAEIQQQLVVRPMRRTLLRWLLASGLAVALVALVLGWALARRTSGPLARLADQISTARPAALPQDLAHDLAHDEVGELARHLDALHARTRAFIDREQAFSADASHELRTPLAVLGIACERLARQATADMQPLLRSMQAAVWHLQQTVELMLALAREAPAPVEATAPQPLLPVLENLLLAHAPLLDQQGVEVRLDVPAQVTRAWPAALTQLLLGNLLANALAHAQSPHIRIEADERDVRVCNRSLPPPASLLAEDAAGRQPGVKGPGSTGQGLGLSIVRRLAERHGLALALSHHDGCTCTTLRSAASPAPAPPP